jgi:16S rRNA (guanine966-N2)-methyltransferase
VFNALGSLDVVSGARVADFYAGSGALGIEALSRGADHCTFVERDRAALSAIHANIAAFGLTGRTRVVSGDALKMARGVAVDLAFADPPYDFADWPALLAVVDAGLLVAEAPRVIDVDAATDPDGRWEQGRTKRYGRTWVTFLHRAGNYRERTS